MKRLLILAILALFICSGLVYAADETPGEKPETKVGEGADKDKPVGNVEDGDDDDGDDDDGDGEGEGEEGEGEGEEGVVEEPAAAIEDIGGVGAFGPRIASAPPQPDTKWHILLQPLPVVVSPPEIQSFSEEQYP